MESLAELGLVVLRNVLLSVKFVRTMSEGAALFEGAEASKFPVLAHLSLVLGAETLDVACLVFSRDEGLLGSLDGKAFSTGIATA